MGTNDRAIDHEISVVAIGRQSLEDLLPYTGMAPAAEALMHRLPLAVAFGQIAPMRPGA